MSEGELANSSVVVSSPQIPTDISTHQNKRQIFETVSEVCASSENKPFTCYTKRLRIMSGSSEVAANSDLLDKQVCGLNKKTGLDQAILQVNSSNPLSERNIRVDCDNNNGPNKNISYVKSIHESKNINSENTSLNTDTSVSLSNNVPINICENTKGSNYNYQTELDLSNDNLKNSLQTAISSLEVSGDGRSSCSSTLDYVAQLPDRCMPLEDVSATPPHTAAATAPYSGDEDDDNYLDSSEGEHEEDNTYDTADESCDEDDGSVVSTVGSTCSLRSVASEALAAIGRNDQGQTVNQDGSLLYQLSPSSEPLTALSPSLFADVPPAVRFCQHNETCQQLPEFVTKLLKWRYTPITPLIIRKTITNSGYKMTKRTIMWSGTWGKHMKSVCFKTVRTYQKVNHFPGTFQIGRKDKLWNNFLRLQAKFGKEEFGFMPKTFVLPSELKALKTAFDKEGVKKKWIVKPPASARGTGIQVVDKWSQLDTSIAQVVQRYVSKPYLINNTKFDLRIYVLVTSFHPLRIYLYQDGLVRFASVEYRNESTSLGDRFMHLTNYSVNKTNSSYTHNTEAGECQGHRWTLCTLWGYLKARGVDTGALWSRIADMVIKTILSGENDIIIRTRKNLRSKYSCFELFGFDVLLDERLRPWLLEVNISPSLHSACSLDYIVKGPLIANLLTMAAFHVPDHRSLTQQMQSDVLADSGIDCRRLALDHRVYTRLLSPEDLAKHLLISALPRAQYLVAAIEVLSPDDTRHLLLGEDELNRAGKFTCIFPTAETHQYFGFLDKPRYYNRLWDAWETAHGGDREKGIKRLQQLCKERHHLIVPPKFKMPKVVGTAPPAKTKESTIVSATTGSPNTETSICATSCNTKYGSTDTVISSCAITTVSNSEVTTNSNSSTGADDSVSNSSHCLPTKRTSNSASVGQKKSKVMRRRRPHLAVMLGRPYEPFRMLHAASVAAARGGNQEEEEEDEEGDDEEDCESEEQKNNGQLTETQSNSLIKVDVDNVHTQQDKCENNLTSSNIVDSGGGVDNTREEVIGGDSKCTEYESV